MVKPLISALSTAGRGVYNAPMPNICAIFTHFNGKDRTLTCLERLTQQTLRPQHVVIINNGAADDDTLPEARRMAEQGFGSAEVLHILQMESNLGNAGGCAHGMNYAFDTLGADYVWALDDDSWPRPDTLKELLAVSGAPNELAMSLVIDPAHGDELSWPLTVGTGDDYHGNWKNILERENLPDTDRIPSRGGWLGALVPRDVWEKAGTPTPELFIRGEDEEYPWKVRHVGYHYITARRSELEHPTARIPLLHYELGGLSFFYEPGLHVSRQYYKSRNWAWLQRLKFPRNYPKRLLQCGFYIIMTVSAMIHTDELDVRRVYNLFRALHNGFYGKLRPY